MKPVRLALAAALITAAALAAPALADDSGEINIHNFTGHEVIVFMFEDAQVHHDEHGGVQFAHLKNTESAVAHIPHCQQKGFSILLVDHDHTWHAEGKDCHTTDLTFKKDTGYAPKH